MGRRQFGNFDGALATSSVLGCDAEELQTAVFKHHLRQLLQKATGGSRERDAAVESDEGEATGTTVTDESLETPCFVKVTCMCLCVFVRSGPRLTGVQCVEGMAAGLYEELFTTIVSLINRCEMWSHDMDAGYSGAL